MHHVLTLSRVFLGPILAHLFVMQRGADNPIPLLWAVAVLLLLIELSDAFDGAVARKLNKVTDFGKFLDPAADSLSRLAVFTGFLVAGVIPMWMFLIFVYRDVIVAAVRYLCASRGVVVSARPSGKLKAILQAIAGAFVVASALAQAYGILPASLSADTIGFWAMLCAALYTAYSAFDYALGNRGTIAESL